MKLRIINNFLHDMATGTWAACVLVICILHTQARGVPVEAARVLGSAAWAIFWLMIGALAALMITGGLRLRYWRQETPGAEHKDTRQLLLIKHIAFLVVYGAGSVWMWLLVR